MSISTQLRGARLVRPLHSPSAFRFDLVVPCREGEVTAAVKGVSQMRCVTLGTKRFKNVSEPVEVFEIMSDEHMSAVVERAVVDPVCHMHVEAVTAPARLPFNGKTYYFCLFQCAEVFTKHPPAYLEP